MPDKPRTVEELTAQILADIDHHAQLMLAGAMPAMPVRPFDSLVGPIDEVPEAPVS